MASASEWGASAREELARTEAEKAAEPRVVRATAELEARLRQLEEEDERRRESEILVAAHLYFSRF